ncbi:MAG TPA: hypothetical protein DEP84_18100 [Chloroflexi bacterium]|nr:hypothetical protein [Chloroflexota bacterium]
MSTVGMGLNVLQQVPFLVACSGADQSDSDEVRLKKTLAVAVAFGSLFCLILWSALFLVLGQRLIATVGGVYMAVLLGLLIVFILTRGRNYHWFITSQLALVLLIPAFVTVMLGGFVTMGGVLWGMLAPVGVLLFYGPCRQAVYWFGAYTAVVVAGLLLQWYFHTTNTISPVITSLLFGLSALSVAAFVFGALYYFVRQRNLFQEKSEALLLNILPAEIAAILKSENRVIADHYEGASILFADAVNFTPLATQMTPIELVGLLDAIFSHFDGLVDKYGLEKIKTIGDCYMVAAGVPRPRPDHAQSLAQVALEMQDYARQQTFAGGRQVAFRIGINSGPVVAGVIGRKKFIYDLWGDTVNTASRMESHSQSGQIQITRATYELIKDSFLCESRGTIPVKGKGDMEVWHIIGRKV